MAVFIGFTCQWPVTDVCAPFLLGGAKKDKVLIFNSEMIARKYLFLLLALFFTVSLFAASEKEWQEAWNNAYAHGKLEVSVTFGRIDILTDEYAIEVDHVHKFHEGIGQALHYAYETGKKPGLALFIDGERDTKEKFNYVKELANSLGIKVWLMNEIINPNKTKQAKFGKKKNKRKVVDIKQMANKEFLDKQSTGNDEMLDKKKEDVIIRREQDSDKKVR